jgi:F-type H+-transporting ATPase subunit delta
MSAYTTIARPYAKAAFEHAAKQNTIAIWSAFFQRLAFIVEDERVRVLLQDPRVDEKNKLDLLVDLAGAGANQDQKNFLSILAHYKRLLSVPALAKLYDTFAKEHENIVDVEVMSAFALNDTEQHNLQKALEIRLGKKIAITLSEDNRLIGGAVIRAGDFVIDGSTLGKLKRLRKLLMR